MRGARRTTAKAGPWVSAGREISEITKDATPNTALYFGATLGAILLPKAAAITYMVIAARKVI